MPGGRRAPAATQLPVILFAVGSAYAIHILAHYYRHQPLVGRDEAIRLTVTRIGPTVLAAGLTGSRLSVDVPPLKSPEGPPHDLGQFYVVIDPSGYSGDGFTERLTTLAATIAEQPGARLPGAGREAPDNVDLEPGLWEATQALAGD